MRHLATCLFAVLALALLAAAAPPVPPPGLPQGMPANVKLTGGGAPDLFARIQTSPYIARGHVLGPVAGSDYNFKVHVDEWLKGKGPSDLSVDFGQQRPVTTPEHGEVLFLGAEPVRDGGAPADLRALTIPTERYEVPDGQTGLVDQVVGDVLHGAPEDKVLAQLVQLPPVFSGPAAARLALRSNGEPQALQDADQAVKSPQTNSDAKLLLVTTVGSHLPLSTLADLARGTGDERLRMAAIEALGRVAANDPAQRAAAVSAIQPAAGDKNPHLQLAAGVALASSGQAEALPPLDAILAGKDQNLRAEAVRALAELARHGNTEAFDRLEKLQHDPDHEVSTRAANLLKGLGGRPQVARPPWFYFSAVSGGLVVILVIGLAVRNRKRRGA